MPTIYSVHARQRRVERNIRRSRIDDTLHLGVRRWDYSHNTYQYNWTSPNGTQYRVCVTARDAHGNRTITTVIRLN
jgi:hypothetical protein